MKVFLFVLLLCCVGAARGAGAPASALAFSPDGSALVSGGYQALMVRSPADAALRESFPCEIRRIQSLAFNPAGTLLAVSGGVPGESGLALVLEWPSRRLLQRFADFTDLVTAVAFSPDGQSLALGSASSSIQIARPIPGGGWQTAHPSDALAGHAGPVLGLAFSPDNALLLTASADGSLKAWSTRDFNLVRSLNNHAGALFDIAIRPASGQPSSGPFQCASASADRTVRVWQPGIGRMVRIVRAHEGSIFALAYSPDGSFLYSAGKEGMVRRIDAASDTVLHRWQAHGDSIYSIAVSPDGKTLATGDWSGSVLCWAL